MGIFSRKQINNPYSLCFVTYEIVVTWSISRHNHPPVQQQEVHPKLIVILLNCFKTCLPYNETHMFYLLVFKFCGHLMWNKLCNWTGLIRLALSQLSTALRHSWLQLHLLTIHCQNVSVRDKRHAPDQFQSSFCELLHNPMDRINRGLLHRDYIGVVGL